MPGYRKESAYSGLDLLAISIVIDKIFRIYNINGADVARRLKKSRTWVSFLRAGDVRAVTTEEILTLIEICKLDHETFEGLVKAVKDLIIKDLKPNSIEIWCAIVNILNNKNHSTE